MLRRISAFVLFSTLMLMFTLLLLGAFTSKSAVSTETKNFDVETSSTTATVYVNPEEIVGAVGLNFTINVDVSNVTDLYGWEFKLGWNITVLDVVEVYEGTFLKNVGDTFFAYKVNSTAGYIIADCTLLGMVQGASGNGTLATIKFYVKYGGDSVLDLFEVILIDSNEQIIPNTAIDGYYYTSMHDVSIISLEASKTTVNVTIQNNGAYTETFNVSVYYTLLTDPQIGTQTITLEPKTSLTLTFTWNPPQSGRYEIRAEAEPVEGEVYTQDNTLMIQIYISLTDPETYETNDYINGSLRASRLAVK
ncbi:MAG: cohesin domain-containing protein [Candidatus Aenigmatarchaeota archaeon]